ncbi:MAG: hypothetical protein M4D80_09850 [Myxococcota bacterium]|nr:hypothetical protein [Deltaproteobacteria bacterium]MDQ3335457.1 hypothetical protein [Myxococcota bacterium]
MRLYLAITITLASCSGSSSLETTTFEQLVDGFATLGECEAATQGSGFNCKRTLTLCDNGGFTLIVTDIVNEGRYDLDGKDVTATRASPGDGPSMFSLTLNASGFESPELAGANPWAKTTVDASSECSTLEGRMWW